MLVGIEVSSALMERRSGVGNYTMNLVAELRRMRGDADFLYFANHGDRLELCGTDASGVAPIYRHDRLPARMVWMQAGLPRSIARTRPDICHFPNHLAPLVGMSAMPYILTIHDMSVYRCPEHHALKTVLTHRAIMSHAARRARLIVTVSESARQDILHYLNVPPEQVRVVYEGVGSHFQAVTAPLVRTAQDETHPASPLVRTAQDETHPWSVTQRVPDRMGPTWPSAACEGSDDEVRRRYGLPEQYVLTVSTLEPRKNHVRLIQAFTQLIRQEQLPHHLVVVGARGWKERSLFEAVARNSLSGRVHLLGYVPGRDLPGLYRGASLFAFPSLYEGFGLPVLEAMASGVPCVLSTDPALCEVAGPRAAVVVDPYFVEDIAAGLYQVLANPSLAARLRAAGIERARAFSWHTCAVQTDALYREVLEGAVAPGAGHRGIAHGQAWPTTGSEPLAPSGIRSASS